MNQGLPPTSDPFAPSRSAAQLRPPSPKWRGSPTWTGWSQNTCLGPNPGQSCGLYAPGYGDDYATDWLLHRGATGALRRVQDHVFSPRITRDDLPHFFVNRAYGVQQAALQREALDNATMLQDMNLDRLNSRPMSFHNPSIYGPDAELPVRQAWNAQYPPNLGRFDFWAGLHDADGVWFYAWSQLRVDLTDPSSPTFQAWAAHAEGLQIIKDSRGNPLDTGFREALANGERVVDAWRRGLAIDTPIEVAPGVTLSVSDLRTTEWDSGTAAGLVPAGIPAVVWTGYRLGNVIWVVVTGAFRSQADESVDNRSTPDVGTDPLLLIDGLPDQDVVVTTQTGAWIRESGPPVQLRFIGIDAAMLRIELP